MKIRTLIVEDDLEQLQILQNFLKRMPELEIKISSNFDNAREILERENFDILVSDIFLNGDRGFDLVNFAKNQKRDMRIVLITGYPDKINVLETKKYSDLLFIKPIDFSRFFLSFISLINDIKNRKMLSVLKKLWNLSRIGDIIRTGALFIELLQEIIYFDQYFLYLKIGEAEILERSLSIFGEECKKCHVLRAGYERGEPLSINCEELIKYECPYFLQNRKFIADKYVLALGLGREDVFLGGIILYRDRQFINFSRLEIELLKLTSQIYESLIFSTYTLKYLENLTRGMADNFHLALEELENRTKALSIIAHELKNMITPLMGFSELLRDDVLNKENYKEVYDIIYTQSRLMNEVLDNILYFSRLKRNKVPLHETEINVSEIKKVLQLNYAVGSENIDRKVIIEEKIEKIKRLKVDQSAYFQIINNLVSNALKYSYPDSEVKIKIYEKDNKLIFSVMNRGPGINREFRNKIFDEFFRIRDKALNTPGLGLGLWVVRELSKLLKGEIKLRSVPGKHTIFSFCLPVNKKKTED